MRVYASDGTPLSRSLSRVPNYSLFTFHFSFLDEVLDHERAMAITAPTIAQIQ